MTHGRLDIIKMTYLQACKIAIIEGWDDILINESVSGNCFQLLFYGLITTLNQIIVLVLRYLIAVTFPISALLVLKNDKKTKEKLARWERESNVDL